MEEFLNRLYSYEYFGTYLMIAIIVLLLIFVIVLFFGKKDQKNREIEETKKLQQINVENTFKEEDNKTAVETINTPVNNTSNEVMGNIPETLDTNIPVSNIAIENIPEPNQETTQVAAQEKVLDNTIVVPNIESLNDTSFNMNAELPVNNPVENLEPEKTVIETLNFEEPKANEEPFTPVFAKEEEKPFVFNDTPIPDTADAPKIPEFNFDDIIKNIEEENKKEEIKENDFKNKEVFSSVFVEEPKIDIPKAEVKEEVKDIPKKEELEMELPTLKKNISNNNDVMEETVKIDLPSLSDLTGESYDVRN